VNDQFLMDTFFSFGQLSDSDLSSTNHCCIAKQALTIADICSGDGTCICCNIALPHVAPFSSNLIWQCKETSAKDWHIWLQALHLAFGPQLIIAIPLGGWLQPPHQPSVHLPYDPASDTLYQPGHHGVWLVFSKLPNALLTNSFTCYWGCYLHPNHCISPCLCTTRPSPNATFSKFLSPVHSSPTGHYTIHACHPTLEEQAWPLYSSVSPTKVRLPPMLFIVEQHRVFVMILHECSLSRLQQLPGNLKTVISHTKTCAMASSMFQGPLPRPMHTAWNYKVSMPYSWPSNVSVLSMLPPLGW